MFRMLLTVLALAGTVYAAGTPLINFKSSLRTDFSVLHGLSGNQWAGTGSNLLTLTLKTKRSKRGRIEAEVDAGQYYGMAADRITASFDSSLAVKFGEAAPVTAGVRKINLSLYSRYADLCIGRQIINFGKGFVFSPIDVYSTVDITDLSFRRTGSDAALARIPLGTLSGIDLIASLGSAGGAPVAVKTYATIADWDVALTGIYKRETYETFAGLSFKGDLLLGVYGELVQHFTGSADNRDFKGMLGLDYSVGTRWLFTTEYYYRESTSLNTAEALYGRHNLFGSVQYNINELMNVSTNTLINAGDGISLTTVQYFYNMFQSIDTAFYIRHYKMGGSPWAALLPYDLEYGTRITVKF